MRSGILSIGAAVLVFATGCSRNDADRSVVSDEQANMTITGCLQAGEQGLASREPNSASQSAEGIDRFVLANAKMPGSAANAPSNSATSSAPLYVLEGKAEELRQFVGQQVEVTGTREAASPGDAPANTQHLEVESVRMIATNCANN
jgi:hypothetical protein